MNIKEIVDRAKAWVESLANKGEADFHAFPLGMSLHVFPRSVLTDGDVDLDIGVRRNGWLVGVIRAPALYAHFRRGEGYEYIDTWVASHLAELLTVNQTSQLVSLLRDYGHAHENDA